MVEFTLNSVYEEDTSSRLMMRWPVSRLKPSVLMSHPKMCLKWLKMIMLSLQQLMKFTTNNQVRFTTCLVPILTLRDNVVQNLD